MSDRNKIETNILFDNRYLPYLEEIRSLGFKRIIARYSPPFPSDYEDRDTVVLYSSESRNTRDVDISKLNPVYISPQELLGNRDASDAFYGVEVPYHACDTMILCQFTEDSQYRIIGTYDSEGNNAYLHVGSPTASTIHYSYFILRDLKEQVGRSVQENIYSLLRKETPPIVNIQIGNTMVACKPLSVHTGNHMYDEVREVQETKIANMVKSLKSIYQASYAGMKSEIERLERNIVPLPQWGIEAAAKGIFVTSNPRDTSPIKIVMPISVNVVAYGGDIDYRRYYFPLPDDLKAHLPPKDAWLVFELYSDRSLDDLRLYNRDFSGPYPHVHVGKHSAYLCIGGDKERVSKIIRSLDFKRRDGWRPLLDARAVVEASISVYNFESPNWSLEDSDYDSYQFSDEDDEVTRFIKVYANAYRLFRKRYAEDDTSGALEVL